MGEVKITCHYRGRKSETEPMTVTDAKQTLAELGAAHMLPEGAVYEIVPA